jgi:hypothetical protein
MFESLEDHMKADDAATTTPRERFFKWAAAGVISVLVLGGIYMVIKLME